MRTELKPNEKVILVSKKHWIVSAKPAILVCLFLLVGFAALDASPEAGIVFIVLACILLLRVLWISTKRHYDIWAVTTLRVIDEYGVFSRGAKESPLDKINNVSFQQSATGRAFGYGDVQIQTAAGMGTTTFRFVTEPKRLMDAITRYQEEYEQSRVAQQAEKLAAAVRPDTEPAGETKECPFCAETIKAKAKVCRFCGKELTETS